MLHKVSRSFAGVIAQLPDSLREATTLFYLILRGLDSVEDDMTIPLEDRCRELRHFAAHLRERGWREERNYGEKPIEKHLLANFHHVIEDFLALDAGYQEIITDITQKMGNGMAKFAEHDVVTLEDYNEYCHYVAGLVGIGLSALWVESGLEDKWFITKAGGELSNQMGLFLQKVNITRDLHEDVTQVPQPRIFWPEAIWSKYADDIEELIEPAKRDAALAALNEMVCNGLQHATASLEYLSKLTEPKIFAFCAVPQVMAIATLALVYNNTDCLSSTVKIRKGEAAKLFITVSNFADCQRVFLAYATKIRNAAVAIHDVDTVHACDKIIAVC